MNRFSAILTVFLLLGATVPAIAQTPSMPGRMSQGGAPKGGTIQGTVVDSGTGQPLPSASIAVRSTADSTLVTGSLTRADGGFNIEGLRPGRYYLEVSFIGYATRIVDEVSIAPPGLAANVGAIRLQQTAVQIEGLEITAERSQAVFAPDRNTYQVKDMPAAAGGTATDVLQNIPAIEVDAEGKVTLRGNQNVAIQINGRAAPMSGDQLAAFLQQLPANMIEKVEVIPNPSAKFDPDGMAGIVNITLRQDADLGTSGGFILGGGSRNRTNASANLGFQQGALTLFTNYGYFGDERENRAFNFRENRYLEPRTYMVQDTRGQAEIGSHNVNTSVELRLSGRDVLSSSLLFSKRGWDNESTNAYTDQDADQVVVGRSNRVADTENDHQTLDYTLGFKRTLEPQRHELSADLRFNRSKGEISNEFTHDVLEMDGAAVDSEPLLETNRQEMGTRELTLQTDYRRPFGEVGRLEFGYKGILKKIDNGFSVAHFDHGQGAYIPDLDRSNDFEFDEHIHAVYGVLGQRVGKFDLEAGVRLEQAATEFHLATSGESYDNDYFSVFPSGLVAYNPTEAHQLKLSYSKRIWRPNTWLLNPFAQYEDPLNIFVGNPYLKPEYTHSIELGYQQNGSLGTLQVTPYYRRTVDVIRNIRLLGDDGVTTTTFRNLDTSESWGADLNGSWRFWKLNGFAGFNAYKIVTDGSNVESGFGADAFSWSARVSATWRATPGLDVQAFYMYRAPVDIEQGRFKGMQMMHLSMRQKLFGNKGNVTLRIVDPFDKTKFSFITMDDRHYQESIRKSSMRGVYLSFGLNFGQQPRIRTRPIEEPEPVQPGFGVQ